MYSEPPTETESLTAYQNASTGALMAGQTLYLATVGQDHAGRIRLIRSMSREFELHGRDQAALEVFAVFVLTFLESREIKELTFVSSPEAGGHMAKAHAYKVEALMQLLPINVKLVPSASLTVYGDRTDKTVPGADLARLSSAQAKLQKRAILAAIYPARESSDELATPVVTTTNKWSRRETAQQLPVSKDELAAKPPKGSASKKAGKARRPSPASSGGSKGTSADLNAPSDSIVLQQRSELRKRWANATPAERLAAMVNSL
jgi:hypothetical protein